MPFYLAIGMPSDEFWNGDISLCGVYLKAHRMRQKMADERMWIQGHYFYEALSVSLHNAFTKGQQVQYAELPYMAQAKKREEEKKRVDAGGLDDSTEQAIAEMTAFMERFNQNFAAGKGAAGNGG